MPLSAKTIRSRIHLLQPLMKSASLETIRRAQNGIGELVTSQYRSRIFTREHPFTQFTAAWLLPRDERREGVILYLHIVLIQGLENPKK